MVVFGPGDEGTEMGDSSTVEHGHIMSPRWWFNSTLPPFLSKKLPSDYNQSNQIKSIINFPSQVLTVFCEKVARILCF